MTGRRGDQSPRRSPLWGGDGSRSAQVVLSGVVYDLRELVAGRGVQTEEMIRIAGFSESAKALWLATADAREPMPAPLLVHRLRVLVDICPPELRDYRERLELGLQILEESERQRKGA